MPFLCSYEFCETKEGKLIPEGEAVCCSKCGKNKYFHKVCFDKHNQEKHNGKALVKHCKEA